MLIPNLSASAKYNNLLGEVFFNSFSISSMLFVLVIELKPFNPVSRDLNAFWIDSLKFLPIDIASPTDFMEDDKVGSEPGNFSNANLGILVTT